MQTRLEERRLARCATRRALAAGAGLALWLALGAWSPGVARASSFAGRLSLGPAYMHNDTAVDASDSSGLGVALQLDAGLQLYAPLAVHATVIYDYTRWLGFSDVNGEYDGSMLGFGLGATASVVGITLGAVAGAQFTSFPSADDPSSGPIGAGLGGLLSLSAGYVWPLVGGTYAGLQGIFRYRASKDETSSVVYDPRGYQLGLVLCFGLEGEPLHGP
jgi:hypothetical protein